MMVRPPGATAWMIDLAVLGVDRGRDEAAALPGHQRREIGRQGRDPDHRDPGREPDRPRGRDADADARVAAGPDRDGDPVEARKPALDPGHDPVDERQQRLRVAALHQDRLRGERLRLAGLEDAGRQAPRAVSMARMRNEGLLLDPAERLEGQARGARVRAPAVTIAEIDQEIRPDGAARKEGLVDAAPARSRISGRKRGRAPGRRRSGRRPGGSNCGTRSPRPRPACRHTSSAGSATARGPRPDRAVEPGREGAGGAERLIEGFVPERIGRQGRPYVRLGCGGGSSRAMRRARVAPDGPAPSLTHRGRAMQQDSAVFVGLDTSKMKISVALAEDGRHGEVAFSATSTIRQRRYGAWSASSTGKYRQLLFCYEAGPTGYGLHRQITALGHDCAVIAPSLIPKRPGERVKTNRRDALTLARLHRAGELTRIWVPDPGMRPCAIWCAPVRPRWRTCARSASICSLSCCATADLLRAQTLDPGPCPLALQPHLRASRPVSRPARIPAGHRRCRGPA